jgi:hypothetical protein
MMESDALLALVDKLGDTYSQLEADLDAERSFRKVYAALGGLLFLYGIGYGSWLLCPK